MPKSNYAPLAAAIKPYPMLDSAPAPVCQCCGDTMNHDRTIPRLGIRPERLVFVCPSCKEVETKELKSVA